jgi:miniconductance mechanosensitive channel
MNKIFTQDYVASFFVDRSEFLLLTLIMLLAFYPLLFLFKKILVPLIIRIFNLKASRYSDILKKYNIFKRFVHIFISFYLFFWTGVFNQEELISPFTTYIIRTVVFTYAMIFVTAILLETTNIVVDICGTRASEKKIPILLHIHIIKVIIVCCSILVILSKIFVVSISSLFASIGATAAVFTFVFKDTVLGLVASIQLTLQDTVRVGDYISVASGVEGRVEVISINLVKIRNRDNSVTVVPTSSLLFQGFKNTRDITEIGARLINRSILINVDTIQFCNQTTLDNFKNLDCMLTLAQNTPELFDASNKVSNITIFRKYMQEYINSHPDFHHTGFLTLVRQLQSTAEGLPIEICVFTKNPDLIYYEEVQSNLFDHVFAIVSELDLKVHQLI